MEKKIAAIKELQQNLYRFFHSRIKCEYYHRNDDEITDEVSVLEPVPMSFVSQKKNGNTEDDSNINKSTIIDQEIDDHNEKEFTDIADDDINEIKKYINRGLKQVDKNGPRQKIDAVYKHTDKFSDTDRQQHDVTFGPIKKLCSELCIVEDMESCINITQEVDVHGPWPLPVVQDIDKCIDSDQMQELCVVIDGIDTSADNGRQQRFADCSRKELCSELSFAVKGIDKCTNIAQEQVNVNVSTQQEQQSTQFENFTIIDFDKHDQNAEVYKIVQDSNDPTLFSLQPTSPNNLLSDAEGSVALDPCIERVSGREAVSIDDSTTSFDDVKKDDKDEADDLTKIDNLIKDIDLIENENLTKDDDMIKNLTANKDCCITLTDIFVKKNKPNPLKNMKLYYQTVCPHGRGGKPKITKNCYETKTASVKKVNKKAKAIANPIKINTTSKRSRSNNKRDNGKYKDMKATSTLQSLNTAGSVELSKEEKSLFINNWIHGSSLVTTPDNDLDVNELLQDAIISSSDIEDDAFQLAKYMEKGGSDITSILNEQNVNNTSLASHSQYPSEPKIISTADCNLTLDSQTTSDRPLDLSIKQTTPSSTDTGFGNGSSLMDQTYSVQDACPMMNRSKCIENNWLMDGGKKLGAMETNQNTDKNVNENQKRFVQLSKDDQNENKFRNCFKTNKSLQHPTTEILSQESSINSCVYTSTSSIQDDNNETAEKEVPTKRRTSLEHIFSIPKKNKKSMNFNSEYTLELVESPHVIIKKKKISQSRTLFNKKFEQTIDYSTDLDYELSEDETSKEDSQKSSTVNRSEKEQSTHTTESTKQLPKEQQTTQWEQLVVKISNSSSNSVSRVVAVGSSSNVITNKTQPVGKVSSMPFSVPAPVNVPVTLTMQNQYNVPAPLTVPNQYNVPPPQAIQNQYNVRAPSPIQNQYNVRAPLPIQNQYNVRAPLPIQNQYNVRAPLATQNQCNVRAPLVIQNLQHSLISTRLSPGPDVRKSQVRYLFKKPCFKFLNETECGPMCGYNHALPPSEEVFRNMKTFSNDMIDYIYMDFVVRSKMSFITYFKVMCRVFGMRRMQQSLVGAIKECENYSLQEFFKWIFEGLINAGLSKRDSLKQIIECCDQSLASYDVLLEIMIDTDALYFVDILTLHHQQGNVSSKLMMKLLQQVVDNPAPTLLNLFIVILDRYSKSNVCDIVAMKMLVFNIRNYIFSTGDLSLSNKFNEIGMRFNLN